MLLAGDIGGTKTHLAIFSSRDELRKPVLDATFPSAQFRSLEDLVRAFLAKADDHITIERASFGVAGPILKHQARITNLPWVMDEQQLEKSLNIPSVSLLNDLDAMAHAIPFLDASELYTLNAGQPKSGETLALIAPGTGLGEAFLTWDGNHFRAHPSEGGHVEFGPTNDVEIQLLLFLLKRFQHVSYEHLCSGIGLPNIYEYLRDRSPDKEPARFSQQRNATNDLTPLIIDAATKQGGDCPLCVDALNMFVSILGAEAGNLALKVMATGGVYIGGGIPPRILPQLERGSFIQAFRSKGRLSSVLADVPIYVVMNTNLALLGAAYHGFEEDDARD